MGKQYILNKLYEVWQNLIKQVEPNLKKNAEKDKKVIFLFFIATLTLVKCVGAGIGMSVVSKGK